MFASRLLHRTKVKTFTRCLQKFVLWKSGTEPVMGPIGFLFSWLTSLQLLERKNWGKDIMLLCCGGFLFWQLPNSCLRSIITALKPFPGVGVETSLIKAVCILKSLASCSRWGAWDAGVQGRVLWGLFGFFSGGGGLGFFFCFGWWVFWAWRSKLVRFWLKFCSIKWTLGKLHLGDQVLQSGTFLVLLQLCQSQMLCEVW